MEQYISKEVKSQMDLLCNLLCYMDELSNGDSEGIYPLPEKVIEDLQRFAKHFYELGIKHQKECINNLGDKQRMVSNLFGLILIVVVGVYDFLNELRKYEQRV